MTADVFAPAVRSFANVTLTPFPVPAGADLPAKLSAAVADYERVRVEHTQATTHLSGNYQREQQARARDVQELRAAAKSGKKVSPHHEDDEAADKRRTLLLITALQGEAREAEANVRKVAVEVADDYRASLADRTEQAREAVAGMVEAIRDRLVELRRVEAHEQWLSMMTSPGVRVKALATDVSGIDECLAPIVRLLAGPGEQADINHYLDNLRRGDRADVFTIPVPQPSIRSSR